MLTSPSITARKSRGEVRSRTHKDLRLFFLPDLPISSSTFPAKQINSPSFFSVFTMSNDTKPVFTDDREKQEPVLGDGGVDSDDSHRPDFIINELIAEGKTPFNSICEALANDLVRFVS
jgi:hypothetical protein